MIGHDTSRRQFLAGTIAFAILPGIVAMIPSRAFAQGALTREQVLFDPEVPVLGNPQGDVTLVEYFDYQCPYCKRAHPDVMRVVAEDGNVRLVMKDWPIFGEPSVYAARLALAAVAQGKHETAFDALMKTEGRLDNAKIHAVLKSVGLNPQGLQASYDTNAPKIDGIISRNSMQARALGLPGTPAFIIGAQLFPGYMDAAQIRRAIEDARRPR